MHQKAAHSRHVSSARRSPANSYAPRHAHGRLSGDAGKQQKTRPPLECCLISQCAPNSAVRERERGSALVAPRRRDRPGRARREDGLHYLFVEYTGACKQASKQTHTHKHTSISSVLDAHTHTHLYIPFKWVFPEKIRSTVIVFLLVCVCVSASPLDTHFAFDAHWRDNGPAGQHKTRRGKNASTNTHTLGSKIAAMM